MTWTASGIFQGPFARSTVLHEGARRLPHILSDKHRCQELVGGILGTVAGDSCVRYYEQTQSHVSLIGSSLNAVSSSPVTEEH
jgi:hypothetical protein